MDILVIILRPLSALELKLLGLIMESRVDTAGDNQNAHVIISKYHAFTVALFFLHRYRFENFTGSNFVLMKLRINEVNENDYGEYGCYAENSEGNGENFVRLLRKLKV